MVNETVCPNLHVVLITIIVLFMPPIRIGGKDMLFTLSVSVLQDLSSVHKFGLHSGNSKLFGTNDHYEKLMCRGEETSRNLEGRGHSVHLNFVQKL